MRLTVMVDTEKSYDAQDGHRAESKVQVLHFFVGNRKSGCWGIKADLNIESFLLRILWSSALQKWFHETTNKHAHKHKP